jgi:hypothetical protein
MAGYKPITSTFLFKNLGGNVLTSKINDAATKGKRYSEHDLMEQFVYIQNYERSLLKQRVLTEFKEGRIELLYADNVQVSKLMPFILVPSQIGHKAIIFLNPFCNMRSDGLLSIRGNLLYTLMESAYLAKNFADNYNAVKNDTLVRQQGALMYANIFIKPINKMFNTNLDSTREGKILFLASKFYLKNVLGIDNDEYIFNVGSKIANKVSPYTLKETDSLVDEEAYADLGTFIQALSDDRLQLGFEGKLQVRNYLFTYISMFGESAPFALESMIYFIFMVNTVRRGAEKIFNQIQLEPIVEKNGEKMLRNLYR